MRKRSICIFFILLLVVAMIIGGLYILLSQTELVDYDETVIISEETYPTTENISIYYDVCFHNVTFNIVDDPGFIIKINWRLTVLVDGAKGKNTMLQCIHSSNDEYLSIQILKENPNDVCALNLGDAEAFVNVTINRAYTIDIEALAGHGNINLTATDATFQSINFHHGINCPGNNGIDITNSTVYGDLICQVSTGHFWVRLENVNVGGALTCTPESQGTLIVL
ncbi:hypothetical protein EU527_01245 [Candidatus Thorarchaeota archaeon]|nr:MAG: hypothetical protein EU527_01245 [Candidatus Thorarchaeota archaeon]